MVPLPSLSERPLRQRQADPTERPTPGSWCFLAALSALRSPSSQAPRKVYSQLFADAGVEGSVAGAGGRASIRQGWRKSRGGRERQRERQRERERERKEESGGTIEAKQNTGEEKGRGRERPSDPLAGCWSSLEREVVEQYGRGFLKRPKVKAILSRKPRCQCRPGRATLAAAGAAAARRQGLFNATSNSTRGRKEGRKEGRSERRSWY